MVYIILAVPLMIIPYFFLKKIDLAYILYLIFIFSTLILGDTFKFYEKVPYWDSIMHLLSGFVISLFAYKISDGKVTGIYRIILCITTSLSIGAIWEMCEFTFDSLLDNNAMRTLNKCGLNAVNDTIKDLVLDLIGSLFIIFYEKKYQQKHEVISQNIK